MKLNTVWQNKMQFTTTGESHSIAMDAKSPIGNDSALTPKQLVLAGISGCTAMDVVALLKKYKQPLETFEVEASASQTEGVHPAIFKEIQLQYKLQGSLDREKVLEAIKLSQSKYCGVSAMISKSAPIHYTVILNEEIIGSGKADFV